MPHGPAEPSSAFAYESGFELSMAYEEELIADIDAKDDHRALRARSAQCFPVGPKDLVESFSHTPLVVPPVVVEPMQADSGAAQPTAQPLISTLAFSPPPK